MIYFIPEKHSYNLPSPILPQKQDKENCDIHYKVTPAAENSKIRLIQDSLRIKLNDVEKTIQVSAELSVSIPARVWIWNYLNFLGLWCMYLWTICGGDVVYYNAKLHIDTTFKINWDQYSRTVEISVLPISLKTLDGPYVTGCKPPWFVKLFSKWQNTLNRRVQDTIDAMAEDLQQTLNIPQTFSPVKNGYVKYSISNLDWQDGHIVIQAEGTFTATIEGRNITFRPPPAAKRIGIPRDAWQFTSVGDKQSHLLQGMRLSSTLLTALMWFADASKETDYHGNTTILDSWINATIFYKPPIVGIPHDMFLNVSILKGVLKADCTPIPYDAPMTKMERKTIFEAAFFNLTGNGTVKYFVSNNTKPSIILQVEDFDLSTLVTKPFKPRIPLPENLQSEIMKALISEMRPVMNAYLQTKAIVLPENLAPFLAHPIIELFHTKSEDEISHGYISLTSYCTCGETVLAPEKLTRCSVQSKICKSPVSQRPKIDEMNLLATSKPESEPTETMKGGQITVIHFQSNSECSLVGEGSLSFKYSLLVTNGKCLSVTEDQQTFYSFDGESLRFKCFDPLCMNCEMIIEEVDDATCHTFANSSLRIGDICTDNERDSVGNFFYLEQYLNENCNSTQGEVKPHLIAIYTSLAEPSDSCRQAGDGNYFKFTKGKGSTHDISYGCNPPDCRRCAWHQDKIKKAKCVTLPPQLSIKLSYLPELSECEEKFSFPINNAIIAACSCLGILIVILLIAIRFHKSITASTKRFCGQIRDSCLTLQAATKKKAAYLCSKSRLLIAKGISLLGLRLKTKLPMKTWIFERGGLDEIIQCLLLLICGAMGIQFTIVWRSKNNPLSLFNNETFDQLGLPTEYFDYSPMEKFFKSACHWSFHGYFSSLCFIYVLAWNFTTFGSTKLWKIVRLTAPIFCIVGALMAVILPSVFKSFSGLIHLKRSNATFVTKNSKAYDFTNNMIQNAVSGLAQSAVSYIWIMVLQGLGGGLYCGSLLYQLIFTYNENKSRRAMLRILHSFISVASLIQPFISLHPVIIWSQTKDSDSHVHFLPLNIAIWLLIMLTKATCSFLCDLLKVYTTLNQRKIDYSCLIMQSVIFLSLYGFLMTLFVQYSDNFSRFAIIAILSIFTWGLTLTFILLSIMAEDKSESQESPKMSQSEDTELWLFRVVWQGKESVAKLLRAKLYCVYELIIFIFERKEYKKPNVFGWRIAGRRFFLIVGTSCFTYEVANLYISTCQFNAKDEIEKILRQTGYHLSWPDNDTIFAGSFKKLNNAKRNQVWTLLLSVLLFWFALFMDIFPILWYRNSLSLRLYMTRWLTASRVLCCAGGILIFSSVIVLASPDYLGASSLQEICPDCGLRFNKAVFKLAEFIIGLFFAGVFTAQLLPILITISPALVRASVLMLLHPSLHEDFESQKSKSESEIQMNSIPQEDSTPSKVALLDQGTNMDEDKIEIVPDNSKDRMRIVLEEMFGAELKKAAADNAATEAASQPATQGNDSGSQIAEKRPQRAVRPKPPVPPRRKKSKSPNDKGRLLSPSSSPQIIEQVRVPPLEASISHEAPVVAIENKETDDKLKTISPVVSEERNSLASTTVPSSGSPKPTKNGFYINPENKHLTKLRVSILRNLIFWSSVVAIPITFLSMSVVFQFQNDAMTKILILAFWSIPILILSGGLFFTRLNVKNMSVLWYYYCLYTISFFGLFISLVIHVLVSHEKIDMLTEYIKKSSFWCEMISEVFLCNVVISDLIYSSLF